MLWKYEKSTYLIPIASPCFSAFPLFRNVASARDAIPLRKCSGGTTHLRTFRRSMMIHLQKTKNISQPQNQFVVSLQIR